MQDIGDRVISFDLLVIVPRPGVQSSRWGMCVAPNVKDFVAGPLAKSFRELAAMVANIADVIEGKAQPDARLHTFNMRIENGRVTFPLPEDGAHVE